MSRIESGKLQLEETEVNLPEMLHDIKTIVSGQVHAKQLELYMDALDVTDEDVYCDRTRMGQILLNLLSNAIKFTPAGGTVSVRVRQLAGTMRDCAQYEFRVRDNGIGMSPEFAQKIFEPFERERTSTVSRIQGTGLGMAITRNIVEMMGGTIKVQTEKNRGTEFIICLPLRVQTGTRREEKIAELAGLKALVVDDDFNTCDSVAKLLTRVGMRGVDAFRPGGCAACTAVHRAGRPLPGLYHRLAAAGHERHRGRAPDSQPERRYPYYHPDCLRLVGYRSGGEGGRRDGLLLQADVPVRPARHPADSHRTYADGGAGHPARENADFRGRHILLVEDNELNREIAIEILHEYGFLVDTAENGAVAVEKIRTSDPGRYDLVLMDVQMPVMDGCTATQRIRALKDPARAAVPIVAMTANVFEEERKRAFDCGMNGFCPSRS